MEESNYLKEEWKPLPLEGCEKKYSISNYGRVRNNCTGLPVSPVITGKPQYWYVNLTLEDGSRTLKRSHRLLAQAFIPNPDNLPMVDHKDRNKYNNSIDNLRWVTRKENQRNTSSTVMLGGHSLLTLCEDNLPKRAKELYNYIQTATTPEESNIEDYITSYEHYQVYGSRSNLKVNINNKLFSAGKLLTLFDVSLESFNKAYIKGLSILDICKGYKNSIDNLKPSPSRSLCIQKDKLGEVFMYYPSSASLSRCLGIGETTLQRRILSAKNGYSREDLTLRRTCISGKKIIGKFIPEVIRYTYNVSTKIQIKKLVREITPTYSRKEQYILNGLIHGREQIIQRLLPNIDKTKVFNRSARYKISTLAAISYYRDDLSNLNIIVL